MTYTSDDFKPGDLAWGTDRGVRDVLLLCCGDLARIGHWVTIPTQQGLGKYGPTDLRPAHVLGPDERAVPKGGVWLDPEDEGLWLEFQTRREMGMKASVALKDALHCLAAEQNAPDPATVWTDGDVVQWVNTDTVRFRDEVWRVAGFDGTEDDGWVSDLVARKSLRVLRQQSTGIGCEVDQ